uniref:Uncharacterized protein n=1 Tax=Arundo donax TaxID=35708 RepID=A0A0A9EZP2_ARUDO
MLGSQCTSHGGQILVYCGSLQSYLMLELLCILVKHVLDRSGTTEVAVLILNLEMEYV